MPRSLVILLPGGYLKGQDILRRRQLTGGIRGKNAGWIVGFIKINIGDIIGIRGIHVQEASGPIGFDAIGLVSENHE